MMQAAYKTKQARELRSSQTLSEVHLWHELRNRKLGGFKFRRQRPIDRFIADFCCDEIKLVVEIYGSIHETDEQREYDRYRQEYLESAGYTVLIVNVDDVVYKLSRVLEDILSIAISLKTPLHLAGEGKG